MRYILQLCILSVCLYRSKCHGANILAFISSPCYSHQTAFRPLWQELARRGHRITLVTTNLMEDNENITQIDLGEAYKIIEKYSLYSKVSSDGMSLKLLKSMIEMIEEVLEYQLSHPEVQMILKKEKSFDLVFSEFLTTVSFIFGVISNAPNIGVVSMDTNNHRLVGNPTHPIANPDANLPFSTNLNFKERVLSTLFWIIDEMIIHLFFLSMENRIMKKTIGEQHPGVETVKNVSIVFICANPIFNNIRPLGPKTINIVDGLHITKPKPLPKDLQEYLDNARKGVIYFSLGSNVQSSLISNTTKEVMLKTFSKLPYQILWKFEDDLTGKTDNIKIQKWLPQQDILRHKNVKLFITQGGVQSMLESIFSHVPMIGMPFFGDQFSNVYKMVEKGLGLSLDHTNLDADNFENIILEVINNPSYKERTIELADLTMDQEMTGLEKAVWWTEYVLRHGGTDHFRDPVVDLPLYQYYLLDVISFVLAVLLLALYVWYQTLKFMWKLVKLLFKNDKIKTL